MDETGVRAALKHYFDFSAARQEDVAHEIYLDDAVLEFPQSGERFDGVANFKEWRRQYNEERPHSSLGYLTPAEYAEILSNRSDGGCAPPNPAPLAAAGVRGEHPSRQP